LNGLFLGLLESPGASAASPEALAELSRTIPEVRHRFPGLPPSIESQGESSRIRLTEAVLELLSAISEEHPVILVVDDLHLADDVSLAVLHLVMRRIQQQPVMILLTARSGELWQSSQATRLRESVIPLSLSLIELAPLNQAEAEEMLKSLMPPDESQPTIAEQKALLRAASGFPMVLELLVQDWKVNGQHSIALSVEAMTFDCATGGPAKAAYAQIFDRMTRSLNSITQNVLNLASILGRRLNDFSLYAMVDVSTGQAMTGMGELVKRRVLRDGAQGLEFVNELLRAAAYVSVPVALRRTLHSNIADRLLRDATGSPDRLGLEIAWHCIRAGRVDEATPYLLRGAREAIQHGAPSETERALTTALPHLTGLSRVEATVLLAEAFQELSRWDESVVLLDQIGYSAKDGVTDLALVLRWKAQRRLGQFRSDELSELPMKLLDFVGSTGDCSSRIKAAVEAASVLDISWTRTLGPSIMGALSSFDEHSLDLDDATRLLLAKAMLLYNMRDFDQSLTQIDKALCLLEQHSTCNSILAMLYNGIGAIRSKTAEYDKSVAAYRLCQQIALKVGNDYAYLQASANLALSLTRLGQYEEALLWTEIPFEYTQLDIGPGISFQAAASAALSWAMMSKPEKVEEIVQVSKVRFDSFCMAGISQAWALYSADSYAMLGRLEEAYEEGRRGTHGANAQLHMDFYAGSYARWVARTATTTESIRESKIKLELLKSDLKRFDAIDQAEVLNASCLASCRANDLDSTQIGQMIAALEKLPDAITEQWRRMGILEFSSVQ
jgi:tetratricopeptide (TPR) repeat protein